MTRWDGLLGKKKELHPTKKNQKVAPSADRSILRDILLLPLICMSLIITYHPTGPLWPMQLLNDENVQLWMPEICMLGSKPITSPHHWSQPHHYTVILTLERLISLPSIFHSPWTRGYGLRLDIAWPIFRPTSCGLSFPPIKLKSAGFYEGTLVDTTTSCCQTSLSRSQQQYISRKQALLAKPLHKNWSKLKLHSSFVLAPKWTVALDSNTLAISNNRAYAGFITLYWLTIGVVPFCPRRHLSCFAFCQRHHAFNAWTPRHIDRRPREIAISRW